MLTVQGFLAVIFFFLCNFCDDQRILFTIQNFRDKLKKL